MSIEAEKETLSRLEGKLAEVSGRAIELQTDRRRLAFDANTGNAKARAALDAANAASATADLEIENVKSAILEARRRLAEAEREAEMARLAVDASGERGVDLRRR